MSDDCSRRLMQSLWLMVVCASATTRIDAAESLQIDACALLTTDQISKVVGMPVAEGARKDAGMQQNGSYSSSCVWILGDDPDFVENPDAPLGGRSFVILNAMQWPSGSGLARKFLEAFHDAARHGEIPSKPESRRFGDEALWWGDGLAVRQGDTSFGLSVFIPDRPRSLSGQLEEQLAPSILEALRK